MSNGSKIVDGNWKYFGEFREFGRGDILNLLGYNRCDFEIYKQGV